MRAAILVLVAVFGLFMNVSAAGSMSDAANLATEKSEGEKDKPTYKLNFSDGAEIKNESENRIAVSFSGSADSVKRGKMYISSSDNSTDELLLIVIDGVPYGMYALGRDENQAADIYEIAMDRINYVTVLRGEKALPLWGKAVADGAVSSIAEKNIMDNSHAVILITTREMTVTDSSHVTVRLASHPDSYSTPESRETNAVKAIPLLVLNNVPQEIADPDFDFATATSEEFARMLNISHSDIKAVWVLKNDDAKRMWGDKGAAGVLMIVTKNLVE